MLLAPVGPPPPAPQRLVRWRREGGTLVETVQPFPVTFIAARPRQEAAR
jgi:hypothetical protein